MKISKLFHWLYAILMLLPFLVFLPNAFYYGFNEHAVAQEKTEQVPVYYESNIVNSNDDLIEGNVYTFLVDSNDIRYDSTFRVLLEKYWLIDGSLNVENPDFTPSYNQPYIRWYGSTSSRIYLVDNNSTYQSSETFTLDFIFNSFSSSYNNFYLNIIKCDRKYIKEYQPITTNMSITDSMSYAWYSVWQNDLFSWSYGSFLTEPFIYIGNVFNVPVDNSLYYALSYWLDISIIWLCFDMVMYIPLLVHRWLDKGIIE